jgi:hypothetical protein
MHVTRMKRGQPATHQIRGDELRALRKLQRSSDGVQRVFCKRIDKRKQGFSEFLKFRESLQLNFFRSYNTTDM